MIKTAIFVEGQTELIFTRELILKYFEWQNIWVECYNLFNDRELNEEEYSFKFPDANFYFQIINVGNDVKVLSSILRREKYLFSENQKFDKIIGLRDMYSKDYREIVKNSSISEEVNNKFISEHQKTISSKSVNPEKIIFHFAIMEIESWILGIKNLFSRLNNRLTYDAIEQHTGISLADNDPETTIFHPAALISEILQIVGDNYDKKKGEVNKFLGNITKEDFAELLKSNKCNTFNSFCKSIKIE